MPVSGSEQVILLPGARRVLEEHQTPSRTEVELCSTWTWKQDRQFRFTSLTGTDVAGCGFEDAGIIGKALWEMPFEGMDTADWQRHRRQLHWRAAFRDLEVRRVDGAGQMRHLSFDGEPVFDSLARYAGYRGVARDITARKQQESTERGAAGHAGSALDALAVQVCVLDASGTVVMTNPAWEACDVSNGSIGRNVQRGANFLQVYESAAGDERADGDALAAGLRQLLEGVILEFRHEYACDSPTGRKWCAVAGKAYREDGALRVVVSRETTGERTPADAPRQRGSLPSEGPSAAAHGTADVLAVHNRLLAALPHADYSRLVAAAERVALTCGDVLYAPGTPIRYVYFPLCGTVSLLASAKLAHTVEVRMVGREGVVGIPLALGVNVSPVRALVLGAGTAMRLEATPFRNELLRSTALQRVLNLYAQALMAQFAQTAACAHFHDATARLARWLLMTDDRIGASQFELTHEILARMLGIRRVGVTASAGVLRKRKLISYHRGTIRITDRKGLEKEACQCYGIIKDLYL